MLISNKRDLRLLVGIPSGESWKVGMATSLICMLTEFHNKMPGYAEQSLAVSCRESSMVWKARQELAEKALEMDATHLLFVDTDQTFPSDLVHRLASWDKDVVACNVATKNIPPGPTARLRSATKPDGEPYPCLEGSVGLKRVWRVGTGVMLIRTSIFERIPLPWFNVRWDSIQGKHVGEDWWFCERLEEASIPIYIDRGLSWEIGHIGKLEFKHSMYKGRYNSSDINDITQEGADDAQEADTEAEAVEVTA